MLLSEMFGVERDTDFGVKGYESFTFNLNNKFNGSERVYFRHVNSGDLFSLVTCEMLLEIIADAPANIIHLPPPLTDEQRDQLKALYTLGYFLLAMDKNGEVFAYSKSISKCGVAWATGVSRHITCIDAENPITRLVSWSDPEPYDIGKALGVEG